MSLAPNRSMPPGSFIPEIGYPNVPDAAAWLCRTFGFVERLRIGDHRVQLTFGSSSMVVVHAPAVEHAGPSPTFAVMVRVDDVDAHFERVRQSGARTFGVPTTYPYGERQYSAMDLAGYRWTFSQSVADVDPAQWGGELKGT